MPYVLLSLASQLVAHCLHGRHHHIIKQVVSLHIHIGGLRCHTQLQQQVLRLQVVLLLARQFALQTLHPHPHLMSQFVQGVRHIAHPSVPYAHYGVEVCYGKLTVVALSV